MRRKSRSSPKSSTNRTCQANVLAVLYYNVQKVGLNHVIAMATHNHTRLPIRFTPDRLDQGTDRREEATESEEKHSKRPRVRRDVHTTPRRDGSEADGNQADVPGTTTDQNTHDIHERNTLLSTDSDGGLHH